ncbi:MAG: NTP transferase domain-containing protein [Bilophila sp.]
MIVLLGDQPLVSAQLVRELAAFFLEAPDCPAAPVCGGVRGHPVALPARAFGAALAGRATRVRAACSGPSACASCLPMIRQQ